MGIISRLLRLRPRAATRGVDGDGTIQDVVTRALRGHDHVDLVSVVRHVDAIMVQVRCLGAGLHATEALWRIPTSGHGSGIAAIRADVARALAPHLARQRMRRDRATRLGIDVALAMPDPGDAVVLPDSLRIDHLVIDRHLLGIVRSAAAQREPDGLAEPEQVLRQLRYDVSCAGHQGEIADGAVARGMNLLRRMETTITDVAIDGGTAGMLRPTHSIARGPVVVAFDGHGLIVIAELPETALAAAVGRPVGDLVATGTPLDARIVTSATSAGRGFAVAMTPDLVRIGDLPATRVSAADVLAMPRLG